VVIVIAAIADDAEFFEVLGQGHRITPGVNVELAKSELRSRKLARAFLVALPRDGVIERIEEGVVAQSLPAQVSEVALLGIEERRPLVGRRVLLRDERLEAVAARHVLLDEV